MRYGSLVDNRDKQIQTTLVRQRGGEVVMVVVMVVRQSGGWYQL